MKREVLVVLVIAATIAAALVPPKAAPAQSGGTVDLRVKCTDNRTLCEYVASVRDNGTAVYFRFDVEHDDGIWDFPDQYGSDSLGAWSTVARIVWFYRHADPPPRACVEAWDGVSIEVVNGTRLPIALLGCAPTLNAPPVPDAGGPYTGFEGAPVTLSAAASTDPDGDNLTYRWDFNGDGNWDTDWSSSPVASHTWGDDWSGLVRVEVSDGLTQENATADVTIANVAPTIVATIVPSGDEGQALTFQAHVTDPGSDDLTFAWGGSCTGWSAPRTSYNDPNVGPDPHPSPDVHPRDAWDNQTVVCGDNGDFTWGLRVTDDDGGVTTTGGRFSIGNLPPAIVLPPPSVAQVDEGSQVSVNATATDPGSDDLTFAWAWQYGPTDTRIYYNNGISPDPANSPNGTYPFTASDASSYTYGHEGNFSLGLTVTDDDGGFTTYNTTVEVLNVAPTANAGPDKAIDEGSQAFFNFTASDPGFDMPQAGLYETLTATVNWGDTTSNVLAANRTDGGPGVPTTATMSASHWFADEGTFTVTLTVCDDGGLCGTDTLVVTANNVAPTVLAGANVIINEGSTASIAFTASDPGYDFPTAGLYENFTATVDWGYAKWPAEAAPVDKVPGGPGVPTTGFVNLSKAYGDNGVFTVTLTVCDDGGLCGSASLVVTVLNVPPTITDVQAYVKADVTLRVAGEKWHDVRLDLVWDGNVTATEQVLRTPGSPSDQEKTLLGAHLELLGSFAIVVTYTPNDDAVNGQANGANPVWVILTLPTGRVVRLHHTFNVQHPDTWTWTIADLGPYLVGQPVTFQATAHDVGSDDLTFVWSFGDGAAASTIYYNNGVSPDPYPSPEVNPITATDARTHTFAAAGTYTVTLTVTDDDGGTMSWSAVLALGS